MSDQKALILFAHGARDPRWATPFERLQQLASAELPSVPVHLAFLELMTPRLPEVVATLAAQGCQTITIVPVFLGQGGHVLRDLPELLEQLQVSWPALQFKIAAAVGESPDVLHAIASYCVASAA